MIHIPMRTTGPLDRQTILSINQIRVEGPRTAQNINTLTTAPPPRPHDPAPAPSIPVQPAPAKPVPRLVNPIQKGQKIPLDPSGSPTRINACLGWDTTNAACDVDVSAFLLNNTGKVPGDNWFVFYGQEKSPDGSTAFLVCQDQDADREIVSVDFAKLDQAVTRIVFVLTINEALERHLDFSMLRDAYIRILDPSSGRELVSFRLDGYYSTVTSMMIGEIYLHKGTWKFNAIGNGVARDLAGLCALYGVQVI